MTFGRSSSTVGGSSSGFGGSCSTFGRSCSTFRSVVFGVRRGELDLRRLKAEAWRVGRPGGRASLHLDRVDILLGKCILIRSVIMQVAKWGNSLAVRLPAAVVQALDLKEGEEVELHVVG